MTNRHLRIRSKANLNGVQGQNVLLFPLPYRTGQISINYVSIDRLEGLISDCAPARGNGFLSESNLNGTWYL